jgi:iron complex transport system ATP-binding protein
MNMFECRDLNVRIGNTLVCDHLDLRLEPQQRWALLGKNGSGKTTLIHTLAGLRSPISGSIMIDGSNITEIRSRQLAQQLGVLFQDDPGLFPSSVFEYTLSGRHPHLGWLQWESLEDRQIATEALRLVELLDFKDRLINTLSGGERRRMNIACLLTQKPQLALLDEPGNHLDLHHQIETFTLLANQFQQKTLLMSLHDINHAVRFCSHALLIMGEGRTLQGKASDVLTKENLQTLYGVKLNTHSFEQGHYFFPA